jgi:short-subunit dehydrogenase
VGGAVTGRLGHVVISGASRGLGAALARRLAAPGVTLGLLARGEAALAGVAAECAARGATVRHAALDVRDGPALAALLRAWDAALPVDCVVANAGISAGTRPGSGAPEGHEAAAAQVAVNLLGAINMVEPLLPAMLARGRGQVALVGSVAGFRGLPDTPGYCAGKAGLWAYGEALRAAHGPAGVAVTVVAPGFFTSAMSARYLGAKPLEITVEAAAARLHRGILRRQGRLVFPWALGGLLRLLALLPAPLSDRLVRLQRFRVAPERS